MRIPLYLLQKIQLISKVLSEMKLTIKFLIAALITYVWHSKAQLQLNQRWKDRNGGVIVVPYTTTSKSGRPTDAAIIDKAVKDLADKARVLKFVQRTKQKAYISVSTDAGGCNSDVGRSQTGTKQTVNLDSGCMNVRSIQQGFLYAVCFVRGAEWSSRMLPIKLFPDSHFSIPLLLHCRY